MIKGDLEMAMDFRKRKDVPHESFSVLQNGVWKVVHRGPKYCNIYRVTDYDEDGLRELVARQREGYDSDNQEQRDNGGFGGSGR